MAPRLRQSILTIILLIVALSGSTWSMTTYAVNLREAKVQGWIGEQADGYLGVVKSGAGEDIRTLVDSINAKRRAEYEKIARRNRTTLDTVEALAGKKAIEKTAAGQFVKLPSGDWTKK